LVTRGKDELANYALSCMPCNLAKWHYGSGIDPKTGKEERLFNPRKDNWRTHFHIVKAIHIKRKTAIGRATENRLQFNQPRQLGARELWIELDAFP
jgi:hypothetical protein